MSYCELRVRWVDGWVGEMREVEDIVVDMVGWVGG